MVSQHLVGVALQQLVSGAVSVAKFSAATGDPGAPLAVKALAPALNFLQTRFTDQSTRLTAAIEGATDRAWRALELVLAGDSLWDRLKGSLAAADMKAFKHDVRGLLAAANVDGNYPVDRKAAARELRAARQAGLLRPTGLTPAGMAESVGVFARFDNPTELAAAQWRATGAVATDLAAEGYPALAAVVAFKPGGSSLPLLGVAIRYFFRRAVEQDAELARGLTFAKLEGLAEAQQNQYQALDRLVTEQGARLDEALGELAAEVAEVKAVALDIRAEQDKLGDQNRQIMEAILALQGKLDQAGRPAVRPQDSLSIRTDGERDLVKKVIAQYRSIPASQRERRPALRNAVGMLEVAAGDFAAAQSDFAAVAESVDDPAAKGAAYMNAYRASLESRDWTNALRELVAAVRCDGRRFAPFPVGKYTPQRILGAGGFGVAFLCKHKYMDAQVVVKTLSGSGLEQDFEAVFTEARAAAGIQHPGIVRVTDCGYAESATKDRPFVVMDYFPGEALDAHVKEKGPLKVESLLPLSRSLAEALGAAHAKGILHRDVKPGNVLVQSTGDGFEVRVIDFGLAIRQKPSTTDASTARSLKTLAGESIAGTVDYAAPEQMGRGSGAKVGPYSDIYGWAKTCCYALFQTPQPTLRHWKEIPAGLADLLGRCLEEDPKSRPQSFAKVITELDKLGSPAKPIVARPALEARPPRRDEDDDDFRARRRRQDREREEERERDRDRERNRPRRKNQEKAGGFPVWAGVAIAMGVVFLVTVVAIVARKKPTDTVAVQENTPVNNPGQFTVPVVTPGFTTPVTPTKPQWNWPGGPPSAKPDLPVEWKETKALGGFFSNIDYKEYRADGSILIGFEVGQGKAGNTDVISYVRSIWQTPSGEQFGYAYGKRPQSLWSVKAKEGYALGGVVVAGGGALEGICFTFLKKKDAKTLDPNDWYVTDWLGEQSRKPSQKGMRAGDGSLVTGIHGRRFADKGGDNFDNAGGIGSIGLYIVPPGANPVQPAFAAVKPNDPETKSEPKPEYKWPGGPAGPRADLPEGWKVTPTQGGIFAKEDFTEFRQDGSILIGFEVGSSQFLGGDVISYLRPIWRTTVGEQFGTAYGKKPAAIWTVKAKDGYALGGVVAAGGGQIEGIAFTFMRVGTKALDPGDAYVSDWYGSQNRKPATEAAKQAGDGSRVVGIYGRRFPNKGLKPFHDDGAIGGLGLVIMPFTALVGPGGTP
ncbi:MAG: protein kinase [Planctomycetes bacterium]|nr:protein kinase [Planctomycetota bacterium]